MHVPFVDLKSQYDRIGPEIRQAIHQVLDSGMVVGGVPVSNFENAFAARFGVKHVIAVGSGTDAIYITLKMLGVGRGDEVITPAMSWISTSETITHTGATPVFADIDSDTLAIDPEDVERRITPRTKAVIAVHLHGNMARISELQNICKANDLFLLEDCAQAHFSSENNVWAGRTGIAGMFSFYPTKNLGSYGQAGCIITDDEALATRCRRFANHGALIRNDHTMEGINSRLDGIQAAVLNVKLKYLNDWNSRRSEIALLYNTLLTDVSGLELPKVREGVKHTFHHYVIRSDQRDALKSYLEDQHIQTAIHYPVALPLLPLYKYLGNNSTFAVAERVQTTILSLPMFPELTDAQVEYVCQKIRAFYSGSY